MRYWRSLPWMLLDERNTGALGAEEFTNILLDPK
jgi:hypothetical protein